MKVLVKYSFIFEPDETFGKKMDIDAFIAQAFDKVGYQTELVQTGGDDQVKSFIYLSPKPFDVMNSQPVPKTPRSQKFLVARKAE
jgi:hypothetical protein